MEMDIGEGIKRDAILGEMVKRLVSGFKPERIYLFGSRAAGTTTVDSDYDLMMVVADSPLPRYRREQAAYRALCGIPVGKDVLVMTRGEFDARKTVVCSLPAIVEREGKLVYTA